MKVEAKELIGWDAVMTAARNTVNKPPKGGQPSDVFKVRMLEAEHGPVKLLTYMVTLTDIPYYVSVHLVRHKVGVEHFVGTQRTDRTGVDRNGKRQDAPVTHVMVANAQALMQMSRRRLCATADPKTREVWGMVVRAMHEVDPFVASRMVPMCVYRGGVCHEMKSCGVSPHWTEVEDAQG